MRRLGLLLALWLGLASPVFAQATHVSTSGTLPATCRVGDVSYKTGASAGLYNCSAANTWTIVAAGTVGNNFFAVTGPTTSTKTFTFPNASATVLTDNALVIAAQGGTSNGFFAVSGPASTTKTFTFPNASANVLTDNALVTVAQGGHGSAPAGDDQVFVASSTTAGAWKTVNDCAGTNQALTYTQSSNTWGCATISGVGGGGAPDNAQYWTGAADATLSAEKNLGALSTGLVINTSGVPSAYAGSACSVGSYVTAVSASGAVTCTSGTTVGSGGYTEVITASDQDVSSNTTVANDSELFFTMAAGGVYVFEVQLGYSSPAGAGTPDFKFAFNGPATLTGNYTIEGWLTTADAQSGGPASGALTAASSVGTAAGARLLTLRGWASSSAGGSGSSGFILQWSQATSSANATRRLTGSVLRYRRIS